MDRRTNFLRMLRFETPESIPMSFCINYASYAHYGEAFLREQMAAHPYLFPDYDDAAFKLSNPGFNSSKDVPWRDFWGSLWETDMEGICGVITDFPLEEWAALEHYNMPDPDVCDGTYPWNADACGEALRQAKAAGRLAVTGLPHGHTFLRYTYLRGFENAIFDLFDEPPEFTRLLKMIETFNLAFLERCCVLQPDLITIPEDLGMQHGPMLSPDSFHRYFAPIYQKMTTLVHQHGIPILMHSDGDIRALWDDLFSTGIEAFNIQDLVNTPEWIADNLKGKLAIELDIDRQKVTPFGTPADIDKLVLDEVKLLGSRQGGLAMIYGLYPGIPKENVVALMDAMEKYAFHYA